MRQKLVALLTTCVFLIVVGATITPAHAHHPRTIWYKGKQWWLSDYYDPDYCFRHHGYYYCARDDDDNDDNDDDDDSGSY